MEGDILENGRISVTSGGFEHVPRHLASYSEQHICSPGFQMNHRYCVPCKPGTYSSHQKCHLCPFDSYNPYYGALQCYTCGETKETFIEGAIGSEQCFGKNHIITAVTVLTMLFLLSLKIIIFMQIKRWCCSRKTRNKSNLDGEMETINPDLNSVSYSGDEKEISMLESSCATTKKISSRSLNSSAMKAKSCKEEGSAIGDHAPFSSRKAWQKNGERGIKPTSVVSLMLSHSPCGDTNKFQPKNQKKKSKEEEKLSEYCDEEVSEKLADCKECRGKYTNTNLNKISSEKDQHGVDCENTLMSCADQTLLPSLAVDKGFVQIRASSYNHSVLPRQNRTCSHNDVRQLPNPTIRSIVKVAEDSNFSSRTKLDKSTSPVDLTQYSEDFQRTQPSQATEVNKGFVRDTVISSEKGFPVHSHETGRFQVPQRHYSTSEATVPLPPPPPPPLSPPKITASQFPSYRLPQRVGHIADPLVQHQSLLPSTLVESPSVLLPKPSHYSANTYQSQEQAKDAWNLRNSHIPRFSSGPSISQIPEIINKELQQRYSNRPRRLNV